MLAASTGRGRDNRWVLLSASHSLGSHCYSQRWQTRLLHTPKPASAVTDMIMMHLAGGACRMATPESPAINAADQAVAATASIGTFEPAHAYLTVTHQNPMGIIAVRAVVREAAATEKIGTIGLEIAFQTDTPPSPVVGITDIRTVRPPHLAGAVPSLIRAASFARSACNASYSGVPRRGGTSAGSPPNQWGIASTTWFDRFVVVSWLAQPASNIAPRPIASSVIFIVCLSERSMAPIAGFLAKQMRLNTAIARERGAGSGPRPFVVIAGAALRARRSAAGCASRPIGAVWNSSFEPFRHRPGYGPHLGAATWSNSLFPGKQMRSNSL
jgi:hypothetical protein